MKGGMAFVFPGQGPQYVGMGKQLYDTFASAQAIFNCADEVLGFQLSSLCFHGPKELLDDTINAQPAILTVSVACLELLRKHWQNAFGTGVKPALVAGHSLGEFTALVAAGVLKFEDALLLVRERGRLMKECSQDRSGGMAAIVGLEQEALLQICQEAQSEGIVTLANDNSQLQMVLSGELAALKRAMELARERGAKVVRQLAISVASHSPLMQQAAEHFQARVRDLCLHPPEVPLLSNITAQMMTTVDEMRQEMTEQLTLPVQWTKSVQTAVNAGVETFIELGPGQVLSGLIRRIAQDVQTISLNDQDIVKFLGESETGHSQ
ncbi:MAG: ACP S-malonyltransferase [Chloroflexaceae bacterium]|nr:ACP S-malonyltransferase [Chloroflexaceae bacterium]